MKGKASMRLAALLLALTLLGGLSVSAAASSEEAADAAEKNGEIYILYTSDVHCGIDEGFGYAGVAAIRDSLEAQGYTTLLVDNGDAIQGAPVGMLSEGETVIGLMNEVGYDIAIPGNHEFDYGMERFLALTEMADFPYISCNFNHLGELVFEPYIIEEVAGRAIAFVGVTTPQTLVSSTPSIFQDDEGAYIYGFMGDTTGEALYGAVQAAVDAARAEGAELVYVMGHLGLDAPAQPWTYADVIEHTTGVDVFLDGHSHDTEQVVMKDAAGQDVVRSACGTKLANIGYSHISADGEVLETGLWSWTNDIALPTLLGIENDAAAAVDAANAALSALTDEVIAYTAFPLTISDPVETDAAGSPIRMVRRAETNLGDLCADALRIQTGADVAVIGGGNVRVTIDAGAVTYGDILSVLPFQNQICVLEVTGQQLLDGLEWGCKSLPGEFGSFLQVSGMYYEVDVSVPSGCTEDENGMMVGIEGERRVKNVTVGGKPVEPDAVYTLAGADYTLCQNGDGLTAFDGAAIQIENAGLDSRILIDYIVDTLGGVIPDDYADPTGQGRIVILDEGES